MTSDGKVSEQALIVSDLLEELEMNWLANALREGSVPDWLKRVLRSGCGHDGSIPFRLSDSLSMISDGTSLGPFRIVHCEINYPHGDGFSSRHFVNQMMTATMTVVAVGQDLRRVAQ